MPLPLVLGTDFATATSGATVAKSVVSPPGCMRAVVFAGLSGTGAAVTGTLAGIPLVHVGSAGPIGSMEQHILELPNPPSGLLVVTFSSSVPPHYWIVVFLGAAGVPIGYVGNDQNVAPVDVASDVNSLVLYGGKKLGSTDVAADGGGTLEHKDTTLAGGSGFAVVCSKPGAALVSGAPAWVGGTTFVLQGISIPFQGSPLTITPDPVSRAYGDADPTFTHAITSGALFPGHVLAGTLTRDAGETVGDWDLTLGTVRVEDAAAVDVSDQYTITLAQGALAITPRPIAIRPDPINKKQGESDPALTYVLEGTLAFSDVLTGALTRVPGEDVGEYPIQLGTVTVDSSPHAGDVANYSLVFVGAVFTVAGRSAGTTLSQLTAFRLRVHQADTINPDDASVAFVLGQEYLATPPDGMGSQTLRPLDGQVESQPYTILLLDRNGYVTTKAFSGGLPAIYGRFVEVQRLGSGGGWVTVDLRRVTRMASPSVNAYEIELSENLSPYETLLWTTSADVQLMPLGPARAWHLLPAAGLTDPAGPNSPGTVLAVSGSYVQLSTSPIQVARELYEVVRDDIIETPLLSVNGNFKALRVEVGGVAYPVIGFDLRATVTVEDVLGVWPGDPPIMPPSMWVAWVGHTWSVGQNVGPMRLYWPTGVPTSAVTPRLIGPAIDRGTQEVVGQHTLATIVQDVLDGTHGGVPIAYDLAAVRALADLGDEGQWYLITAPVSRGEFLRREIWGPYLIGPFTLFGVLTPRVIWPGDAVPTDFLMRFGAARAVSSLRYEYGASALRSVWRVQFLGASLDEFQPAQPLQDLAIASLSRTRLYAGRPQVTHEVQQAVSVLRRVWVEPYADLYSERIFALAGDGVQGYTVDGQITDDAPSPGDLVLLLLDELRGPNPALALRSGSRVALVIERTRVYSGESAFYHYQMWDAGARAHSASHGDAAHADTHSDSSGNHLDYHFDFHRDAHGDTEHGDTYTDETGHQDSHGDVSGHQDSHNDGAVHGDAAGHQDSHVDVVGPPHQDLDDPGNYHDDFHQDREHADAHGDDAHLDTHADALHVDVHADTTHRRLSELDPHCDVLQVSGIICFHDDSHADHADHADAHKDGDHNDGHNDVSHIDGHDDTHVDNHTDNAGHTDAVTHLDDHTDTDAHTDNHNDAATGGEHADSHLDQEHIDGAHADAAHVDYHQDGLHTDGHSDGEHTDWHDDGAHQDAHEDSSHTDLHTDFLHNDVHVDGDAHQDAHSDDAHQDSHTDFPHDDAHGDAAGPPAHEDAHTNNHNDIPHTDSGPHVDVHIDSHLDEAGPPHGDADNTEDVEHQDAPHQDEHTDSSHSDVPHQDVTGFRVTAEDLHCDDTLVDGIPCHTDSHGDDFIHYDSPHVDIPHSDSPHVDEPYQDYHDDAHDDVTHSDGGPHVNTHDDQAAHSDAHTDDAHEDLHDDALHVDGHADRFHQDGHGDTVHVDTHTDNGDHLDSHSDATHSDAHRDQEYADAHADVGNGPAVGHVDVHVDLHGDGAQGFHLTTSDGEPIIVDDDEYLGVT